MTAEAGNAKGQPFGPPVGWLRARRGAHAVRSSPYPNSSISCLKVISAEISAAARRSRSPWNWALPRVTPRLGSAAEAALVRSVTGRCLTHKLAVYHHPDRVQLVIRQAVASRSARKRAGNAKVIGGAHHCGGG